MSCIIIYKNNQPIGVQDAEGNSSELFQQILSNPHVKDFNAALEIYQNVYSDKIELAEVVRPTEDSVSPVIDKLRETGLADNVYQMTGEEIKAKLDELGVVEGKSVQGVGMITNGFTYDGDVYLNTDQATAETAIHEFNHLYTHWLKTNRPEVYQRGLDLVAENTDGALDEIIANVKATQPNLAEGSEDFNEEVLTEAVGRKGAKILAEKAGSPFANWLQEVWDSIKSMLGLSQYSTKEIMDMNLEDFVQASAVDLLSGKVLPVVNNTTNSRPIKPFTESYPLSFVKPSDVIDFKALLADIQAKGQKVWFWMGDQLGRGHYKDSVTGEEHFMDAGVSYALDPANRSRGAIWASGLAEKTLTDKTNESDYIFIISGSPTKAKLFNNAVQKVFTDRIGDFSKFKEDVLKVSKVKKEINEVIEGKDSWDDFKKAEMKNFIISLLKQEKSKTPLKKVLEGYNVFLDVNELRDGFLVANDFDANDVMLVLKPTHVGGESAHSTYGTEVMGEVVGVPDIIVNSYDIIDEKAKEKYTKELGTSQKTKVVAAEIGKTHKIGTNVRFSKKEPSLIYKDSKGNTHTSLQEALKNTPEGSVSMGIDTLKGFKELASVDANSNIGTKEGIINNLVSSNLLSGESYVDTNGQKVHKIAGNNRARKAINSVAALSAIRQQLGIKAAKTLSNGDIQFDENHTKRQVLVTKKDGSTEYITPEDLSAKSFSELKRDYDDALAIVTLRDYKSDVSIYGEELEPVQEFMPENELQLKLMSLLKSMGVKTTSIADYVTKYGAKNGVEPSAQALADLANNVVAFKDGVVNADDLLEETAHFIVAATSEADKADMKRSIHKTPEWIEFQASYREIYGQTYSGEELEDIVREEILGKVLKNAVKNRFKAETETQQNFYTKALEFFKSFFTKVENYFKSDAQRQLDTYTSAVYNNLMNDTLNGMLSGENNSHYVLYSTSNNTNSQVSQIYKQTEELLNRLTQQQRELSKKYNSPGSQNLIGTAKRQMENLEGEVEEVARLKALSYLAMAANSQANILTRVIDNNLKSGYHFSQEENSVYQNFIHKIQPLLRQINVQLDPKSVQEKKIKAEIESVLDKLKDLEGNAKNINDKALDSILDRIVRKNSFTDAEATKYRDEIKKILEVAQKDTQFLHANLGSLTNAKNGFLNLAGDVIERVQNTERGLYIPKIKGFLNSLDNLDFDTRSLKKFIRNGQIINEVDSVKEKQADLEDKRDSYNNSLKNSTAEQATAENIEEKITELNKEIKALEASKADKQKLTDLMSFRQTYEKSYKSRKKERFETYFSDNYLKDLDDASVTTDNGKYTKKDIAQSAKDADKFYRSQVMEVRMNAENGVLTQADADSIKEVNRQRLEDSSARDSEGKLKKGLVEVYDGTLGKYLVNVDYTIPMSDSDLFEAEKVHGLQMIALINQEFYKSQPNLNGIPTKFLDELNKLGSEKEKWDFVQLNSYLGFDDSFWAQFGQEESLIDKLRDEGHDDLVEEIRGQQQVISNILKKNRVFNNPSETDANEMNQLDRDSIKNAQSVLENKYSTARGLVKETSEENRATIAAESVTNEAYAQRLEDDAIKDLNGELNFILGHVTSSNVAYIDTAKKLVAKLKNGEDVRLNKTFAQIFDEDMTADELDSALLSYAKSKLLPYYKRTEPTGYSDRLADLKKDIENNVPGTVENVVTGNAGISSDLKVSPSFSFFESTQGVNPQWLSNRDAGRPQYSQTWLNRVRNDEFHTMFGINPQTRERVGNTNQKDWEAREEILKLQDWTLDNYRLTGATIAGSTIPQRYSLPQQRKSAVRRGLKGAKATVGDMVGWREDEMEYGQDINGEMSKKGSTLLTIPTYGVNKIENQEDVTDELLESYAWMAQQSALHRARRENIGDMLVLNDLISNTTYENKEANATNTYKMFKSFMDANFYGVQEGFSQEVNVLGKRVDVAKIAKTFNSWVKFSSLSGITVPATSLVTGRVAGFVEKAVGEVINPMAYKKAHVEFLKEASAAAAEIGGFTSHSKLNVVLEAIGVYNTNERFQNSNYNRAFRTGMKTSSGLNELGNFPVSAPLGLSVIYDYKYYGNDIVTFDQFKQKNPTKDANTLKNDWEKLDQFYNDWVVKDGVLSFDKVNMAKNINVADIDELISLKMEAISAKAAALLARTDARVPEHHRSVAARDARANFFLTFLNWFTINSQLKLKDRHYNLAEQKWQEGSWRSTFNFLESIVMNPKDIKKIWDASMADDVTRMNLKRTVIELGVANALAVAAMLLAQLADDDEDESFLLAYSSYMLDRLAVEQVSSTIALPRQLNEMIENPIISAQKLKDLSDIMDVFSDEKVTKGAFAGETERMKFARKNLPFVRDYARFRDLKTARTTYEYFNVNKSNIFDNYTWLSNFFDEE